LRFPFGKFHAQTLPKRCRGAPQRCQRDGRIAGIEESFYGRAAGLHPASHFGLAQPALLHFPLHLKGQHPLDGRCFDHLEQLFFTKKVIEIAADV
jgi:hypothetical protein